MRVDDIKIIADEDGFYLDIGELAPVRIEDPEALYDEVKRVIGPWLYERDMAKATMPTDEAWTDPWTGEPDPNADATAYALNDPKHPTYHDRMSEVSDG